MLYNRFKLDEDYFTSYEDTENLDIDEKTYEPSEDTKRDIRDAQTNAGMQELLNDLNNAVEFLNKADTENLTRTNIIPVFKDNLNQVISILENFNSYTYRICPVRNVHKGHPDLGIMIDGSHEVLRYIGHYSQYNIINPAIHEPNGKVILPEFIKKLYFKYEQSCVKYADAYIRVEYFFPIIHRRELLELCYITLYLLQIGTSMYYSMSNFKKEVRDIVCKSLDKPLQNLLDFLQNFYTYDEEYFTTKLKCETVNENFFDKYEDDESSDNDELSKDFLDELQDNVLNGIFEDISEDLNSILGNLVKMQTDLRAEPIDTNKPNWVRKLDKKKCRLELLASLFRYIRQIYNMCDEPNNMYYIFRESSHPNIRLRVKHYANDGYKFNVIWMGEHGKYYMGENIRLGLFRESLLNEDPNFYNIYDSLEKLSIRHNQEKEVESGKHIINKIELLKAVYVSLILLKLNTENWCIYGKMIKNNVGVKYAKQLLSNVFDNVLNKIKTSVYSFDTTSSQVVNENYLDSYNDIEDIQDDELSPEFKKDLKQQGITVVCNEINDMCDNAIKNMKSHLDECESDINKLKSFITYIGIQQIREFIEILQGKFNNNLKNIAKTIGSNSDYMNYYEMWIYESGHLKRRNYAIHDYKIKNPAAVFGVFTNRLFANLSKDFLKSHKNDFDNMLKYFNDDIKYIESNFATFDKWHMAHSAKESKHIEFKDILIYMRAFIPAAVIEALNDQLDIFKMITSDDIAEKCMKFIADNMKFKEIQPIIDYLTEEITQA